MRNLVINLAIFIFHLVFRVCKRSPKPCIFSKHMTSRIKRCYKFFRLHSSCATQMFIKSIFLTKKKILFSTHTYLVLTGSRSHFRLDRLGDLKVLYPPYPQAKHTSSPPTRSPLGHVTCPRRLRDHSQGAMGSRL